MSTARRAVRAEWTKLRTTPGTAWLLLATATVTVALSAAVTAAAMCPRTGCDIDTTRLALSGVYLGQAPVAALAVLTVSGEYSLTLIRTTLTAIPMRPIVLAAKAFVLSVPVAAAGGLTLLTCLLITRITLSGNEITTGRGYPGLSLTDGITLRAGFGTVAYLVLIAVLSVGVAAVVRDSAAAIGTVLGLLYLPPILAQTVADPHLHRLLERFTPMNAGLAVQATTDLDHLPVGPWTGLGVLAAWSAGALLTGVVLLQRRDT